MLRENVVEVVNDANPHTWMNLRATCSLVSWIFIESNVIHCACKNAIDSAKYTFSHRRWTQHSSQSRPMHIGRNLYSIFPLKTHVAGKFIDPLHDHWRRNGIPVVIIARSSIAAYDKQVKIAEQRATKSEFSYDIFTRLFCEIAVFSIQPTLLSTYVLNK